MAAIYFSYPQRPTGGRIAHMMIRSRTTAESSPGVSTLTASIGKAIGELDPSAGVEMRTTRQTLAFAFLPSQVGAALLGSLGFIGVTLVTAGLFAMLSYTVTRRTREIGIRMALGSQPSGILRLVLGEGSLLVVLGLAGGLTGALALRSAISAQLYGVGPLDPAVMLGAGAILAATSFIACLGPARRAARVSPIVALSHH